MTALSGGGGETWDVEELLPANEELYEEMLLLKEIFVKEMTIVNRNDVELDLKVSLAPSTGDRWDLKFVFLDLIISLHKHDYPSTSSPTFKMSKVRGVSEEHQTRILDELSAVSAGKLGECILYELIEHVQETLTQNNMPAGNCPICLESFSGYCHFTITGCTHYFHMACLNEHLIHLDKTEDHEARCPSCREILDEDYVEALQRNTYELGLKCNLHKPEKQKFILDQSIIDQQLRFQDLYLKQKANNAFFTGEDSHVLDLTSRSIVARSLENAQLRNVAQEQAAAQQREQAAAQQREQAAAQPARQRKEAAARPARQRGQAGAQPERVQVASSASSCSQKKPAPPVQNKDPVDDSLIISFSNLIDSATPEPNSTTQDKLGSTGSTAPSISNIEDSQSELSVSLSHESAPERGTEKDDLCYTDEEGEGKENEEEVEQTENSGETLHEDEYEEEEEEEKEEYGVETGSSFSHLSDEDNDTEAVPDLTDETTDHVVKEVKIVNIEEEEEVGGQDQELAQEYNEDNSLIEDEDVSEATADFSEVTIVSSKSVSFDDNNLPKNIESREIQTQTRRVKRNRNKRRSGSRNDGNFRREGEHYEGGNRSGRGGQHSGQHNQRGHYNNNNNNNISSSQDDEVVYRRGNRGRGNREHCRSFHEGMQAGMEQAQHPPRRQEYRRHSFSETWRPDGQGPDKKYNNQQRPGRDYYVHQQQPPQQPRFKPPRILRQEALAQAKKLSQSLAHQDHANNIHKIPVSMYNPNGAAGSAANFPVFRGYQMTQIPPHLYQQAVSNYHQQVSSRPALPPHKPLHHRHHDHKPMQINAPGPGSNPSNKPPTLSPTSHNKVFDVSRFQQSILRNNSPTGGSTSGK